jgi:RNA polymerase sigma factor (sigma-70 family)
MAAGYAYSLLRDFHMAEDAAQDAFMGAFLGLPRLKEPSAFPGWFRRIVHARCARYLRQSRGTRVPLKAASSVVSPDDSPDSELNRKTIREQMYESIQDLPEEERTAVTLFYIASYGHRDIAAFLDVQPATVNNRLRSARKRLKEEMLKVGKEELSENAPSRDNTFAEKVSRMIQPEDMRTESYIYGVEPVNGHDAWALMCAAAVGDMARVQALLDRDPALVNAQYWYQFPIHIAVREGHAHIVQLLLERGADPGQSRFTYNSWNKLLATAGERGHDTVKRLLEQAMAERFNYDPGFDKLRDALRARDPESVDEVLKERPDLATCSDAFGTTALHTAALTRQLALIDRFLDLGVDIDVRRADGRTPLQFSLTGDYWFRTSGSEAIKNRWVVAGYLLAHGAHCPLTVACTIGDIEAIERILKLDPSEANKLDSVRQSPLACAADQGYTDITKMLLDHGADPNQPEESAPQGAALFEASAGNYIETAQLLLENGADPNAGKDSSGTCLTIVEFRHSDACGPMQDLLRKHGAEPQVWAMSLDERKEAVRSGRFNTWTEFELDVLLGEADGELIDLILDRVPDIAQRIRVGLVHGGSLPSDPECARKLLEAGLDPNRPNWIGRTFLHKATEDGNVPVARLLLEAGADINAIELEQGGTPLAGAVREEKAEMVRFLLERGADALAPVDSEWATPLYWARKKGNEEIIGLLEGHTRSEM